MSEYQPKNSNLIEEKTIERYYTNHSETVSEFSLKNIT